MPKIPKWGWVLLIVVVVYMYFSREHNTNPPACTPPAGKKCEAPKSWKGASGTCTCA